MYEYDILCFGDWTTASRSNKYILLQKPKWANNFSDMHAAMRRVVIMKKLKNLSYLNKNIEVHSVEGFLLINRDSITLFA